MYAQRRPTLTGGNPQLPSAQKSLTSVFGMGTGVASLPSSLDYLVECLCTQKIKETPDKKYTTPELFKVPYIVLVKSSID